MGFIQLPEKIMVGVSLNFRNLDLLLSIINQILDRKASWQKYLSIQCNNSLKFIEGKTEIEFSLKIRVLQPWIFQGAKKM